MFFSETFSGWFLVACLTSGGLGYGIRFWQKERISVREEKALEIISKSDFREGLVAGLSDGIAVVHKFGERRQRDLVQLKTKPVFQAFSRSNFWKNRIVISKAEKSDKNLA